MKLSLRERETIITWNEAEGTAQVYTHNPALQRQLSEFCASHSEQVQRTGESGLGGMTFELPKKWVKITQPRKPSPAQLEVLARMNEKRHGSSSV